MSKIKKCIKKNGFYIFFAMGVMGVLIALLPYLILGEQSVVSYQDQLDGEVIAYLLQAKNFMKGIRFYQEMMNGISVNGLFPPAPLVTLLYVFFKPFTAYAVNQILCMLAGFIGMYLCIAKVSRNYIIALIVGVLYAFLPMLSVYGFCQYGQPLLFYALYLLHENKHKLSAFIIVILYGFMSSFILIGFAVLGIAFLYIVYMGIRKTWRKHIWFIAGIGGLLFSYLIVNHRLIFQIFSIGEQIPSHKEALLRSALPFGQSFKEVFFDGTLHMGTHQQPIVILAGILILFSFYLCWKQKDVYRQYKGIFYLLYILYACNAFFALFYAFCEGEFVAQLRNRVGGVFKEFQFERLYWLSNSLWYFVLALCMYLLYEFCKWSFQRKKNPLFCMMFIGSCVYLTLITIVPAGFVYYYSDFNKNIHRLRMGEEYQQITWGDYYASDIFTQIDQYISESTGEDKTQYRTLSLGICPAAPIYNGFYCLDGYSNNYSLAYMQQFREIIADELDKDPALERYYDNWGNRCYVLSHELGVGNYMFGKGNAVQLQDFSFNAEAAKDMGARYLFSAFLIPNAEKLGVQLEREEPFTTATSFYAIYLYRLL